MTVRLLHRPYGIRIHTDDISPAEVIGGLTTFNVRDNVQVDRETSGGDIYPSITTLTQHGEEMEFSSLNVDQVLDVVGTTGVCLKSNDTKTGFEAFTTKLDECNHGISSAAENYAYKCQATTSTVENLGLLYPGSLSVPHQGNAEFSFMVKPRSASGNAGIAVEEGVTLPTIADSLRRFGMGRVVINDVLFPGKTSVDINFGVSITEESADGSLFPEWVAIENVAAIITIRGIDRQWASEASDAGIPRGGRSFEHSDTEIFIRRKNPELLSGFWADADTEHIKITGAGKSYCTELATGNAKSPLQSAFVMYVEKDGTNAPLIAQTGVAIPALA